MLEIALSYPKSLAAKIHFTSDVELGPASIADDEGGPVSLLAYNRILALH